MNLLAQKSTELKQIGGDGLGPFGNIGLTPTSGINAVAGVVSSLIGFMTVAAAIWFLFQILYGGYQWVSSGGDSKQLAGARDRLTHAFIGLTIVVGAWALLAVAAEFFGVPGFLDPASVIDNIKI